MLPAKKTLFRFIFSFIIFSFFSLVFGVRIVSAETVTFSPDPLPNKNTGDVQVFSVTVGGVVPAMYDVSYQDPSGNTGIISTQEWTGESSINFFNQTYPVAGTLQETGIHTINVRRTFDFVDYTILSSRSFTVTAAVTCPSCPGNVRHNDVDRPDGNYNKVILWDDVSNEEGYKIYLCQGSASCLPSELVAVNPNVTSYTVTNNNAGFAPGTIVVYAVVPTRSGCSEEACQTYVNYVPSPTLTPTETPTPTSTPTTSPAPTGSGPTPTPSGVWGTISGPSTVIRNNSAVFSGYFYNYYNQQFRVAKCSYVNDISGLCDIAGNYGMVSGCTWPTFPWYPDPPPPYPYSCTWQATDPPGLYWIALKTGSATGPIMDKTSITVLAPTPTLTPTGSPSPTPTTNPSLTPTLSPTPTPCGYPLSEQISISAVPDVFTNRRAFEDTGGIEMTVTINNAAYSRNYCVKYRTPSGATDTIWPCETYTGSSGGSFRMTKTYGDPNEVGFHRIYVHSNSCGSELGGRDFEVYQAATPTPNLSLTPTPTGPTPTPYTNFSAVNSYSETTVLGYCVLHYTSNITPLTNDSGIRSGAPGYFRNSTSTPSWCVNQSTVNQYGSSYQLRCDKTFNDPPLRCDQIDNRYKEGICAVVNGVQQANACSAPPTGPHTPYITGLQCVPGSCGDYSGTYQCQVEATGDVPLPGTYRFGAENLGNPDAIVRVARNSNPPNDSVVLPQGFSNVNYAYFSPGNSECGSTCYLHHIQLELQTGNGQNWPPCPWWNPKQRVWVNVRVSENDGYAWSDIPNPLRGENGEYAETGGLIEACNFKGTVDFSFLGSRPALHAGVGYRIFAQYSGGQLAGEVPSWQARWIRSPVDGINRAYFAYKVFARKNFPGNADPKNGGTFGSNSKNPISTCSGNNSNCLVWWKITESGDYTVSADVLANNDINNDWRDHVITGLSATGLTTQCSVTVPVDPWFQTKGGNIHVAGRIQTDIPPSVVSTEMFSTDQDSYPGVVSYEGVTAPIFGKNGPNPRDVSSKKWLMNDTLNPVEGYEYYKTVFKIDSNTPRISCGVSGCPSNIASGYYYAGDLQDLSIESQPWAILSGRKVIVFVDGDLNIGRSISVPIGSFLAFIVKGDIRFSSALGSKSTVGADGKEFGATNAHAQGVYLTDQKIETYWVPPSGEGAGDGKRLVVAGLFFAQAGISLNRDLKNSAGGPIQNSSQPAELFIFRPDLVVNAPKSLFSKSMSWQEVAP